MNKFFGQLAWAWDPPKSLFYCDKNKQVACDPLFLMTKNQPATAPFSVRKRQKLFNEMPPHPNKKKLEHSPG